MKLVTTAIERTAQINPHIETLSSADDETIIKETMCVMLLTILFGPAFEKVNFTGQHQRK